MLDRTQGGPRGRSVKRDFLDAEKAMLPGSLEGLGAAAIFLDFAAAFQSIPRQCAQERLRRVGAPAQAILAAQSLRDERRRQIPVTGRMFEGFHVTSGARPGRLP